MNFGLAPLPCDGVGVVEEEEGRVTLESVPILPPPTMVSSDSESVSEAAGEVGIKERCGVL